jgi:hypothetical protein
MDFVVQVFVAASWGAPELERFGFRNRFFFRNRFAFAAVPFPVGAGFYGASCWRWAPTGWGWQHVLGLWFLKRLGRYRP